jgi:hypothetical protein
VGWLTVAPAGGIITGAEPIRLAGSMEHPAGHNRLDGTSRRLDLTA